jgi:FixJ family two-component response regulator
LEVGTVTTREVIGVIDDSEIMRDAMVCLLSSSGFDVEVYASATEFLAAANATRASCLVSDIELGDLLGTEMVRELLVRGYSFPVVFMTGSMNETIRRAATMLGSTLLTKPFFPGELLHAIERAVAPQSYRKCG